MTKCTNPEVKCQLQERNTFKVTSAKTIGCFKIFLTYMDYRKVWIM